MLRAPSRPSRPSRSPGARLRPVIALLVGAALAQGCGKKSDAPARAKEDAGVPGVAPLSLPPIGIDQIKRLNFVYEAGRAGHDKAMAAYRARPRAWADVRTQAELAVTKDPLHLDAHVLLAKALAEAGEHAAAVDHLVTALAGDYLKYGPGLQADPDFTAFLATSHGQAVAALAARIAADLQQKLPTAVWLVARRSGFKWPTTPGVQSATTRGELYAYDVASKRYVRLSHTDHKVAGFARSASGSEVALLGFDKVDQPKADPKAPPTAAAPPTLPAAWVLVLDTATWQPIGKRISVPAGREIALGYGTGDQLLVVTAPAAGRWGVGTPSVATVDRTTGKLTTVAQPPPVPRIAFTLDEGRVVRAPDGVTAAWAGEPAIAPTLTPTGGVAITAPESGQAAQATLALAPGGAHLAFATAVDPCAKDTAPSLYVATTATGSLKHVLTARSRFTTRWIGATTLAYEDGEGAIRLWDAASGREVMRLDNKPGIALDVLSLAAGPLCKGAPPVAAPPADGEPADSATADPAALVDDEPPLPPEEPAGVPVTRPE